MLAVTPALTAKAMIASLPSWLRKSGILFLVGAGMVACAVKGVSVYAWTLAAPMIVRVQWIWVGVASPITISEYLHVLNPWLPLTAVTAMATRIWLATRARNQLDQVAVTSTRRDMLALDAKGGSGPTTPYLNSVGAAFVTTVLISGLLDSVFRGLWLFSVLMGLFLARSLLLPKVPSWQWWSQMANRVPLLIRSVATILAAYGTTRWILSISSLSPGVNPVPGAFGAEIFCFMLALVIAFLLLPVPSGAESPELSNLARRSGKLAVFGIMFVLATRTVYASICLDPFCCFGANTQLAAAAVATLLCCALIGLLFAGGALALAAFGDVLAAAILDAIPLSIDAVMTTLEGEAELGGLELDDAIAAWSGKQKPVDSITEWI